MVTAELLSRDSAEVTHQGQGQGALGPMGCLLPRIQADHSSAALEDPGRPPPGTHLWGHLPPNCQLWLLQIGEGQGIPAGDRGNPPTGERQNGGWPSWLVRTRITTMTIIIDRKT